MKKQKVKMRPSLMEYILIAVLVAAATAVAIWYFGRSAQSEAIAASHAVVGDDCKAANAQSAQSACRASASVEAAKSKIMTQSESAADIDGDGVRAAVVDIPVRPTDRGRGRDTLDVK